MLPPALLPPALGTYWTVLDKDPPELHRVVNGELEQAVLVEGPSGFAVADSPTGRVESEVPNLLLQCKPPSPELPPQETSI